MVKSEGLAARLAGLEQIGIRPDGVWRLAWTQEDAACREWFERQAETVGLKVQRDPAGNLWACPDQDPPWWGIGSHLDSVRGGGRFDGPLGVACGFEIAAATSAPVAVLCFADEEGARFNTPTFGSKALAGRLDLPAVLARTDDLGVALGDAMRAAGVDPARIGDAPAWLERLAGFIEIHIDQTTELARAGRPVGIVSSLASRTRLEARLIGRADHAGTTPRSERRDALAAAARLIVGADELGVGAQDSDVAGDQAVGGAPADGTGGDGALTVTTSRILASPNAPTTIAAEVRLWIDARAPAMATIDAWRSRLDELVRGLEAASGVEISLSVASRTESREFAPELRAELAGAVEQVVGDHGSELVCFAGHDAGVLAERLPAAMLLVRNPTGISHAPAEDVDLRDAAIAASVVERALSGARAVA
jgi:N-carbamoyl-L-amino-acid hydrolase